MNQLDQLKSITNLDTERLEQFIEDIKEKGAILKAINEVVEIHVKAPNGNDVKIVSIYKKDNELVIEKHDKNEIVSILADIYFESEMLKYIGKEG